MTRQEFRDKVDELRSTAEKVIEEFYMIARLDQYSIEAEMHLQTLESLMQKAQQLSMEISKMALEYIGRNEQQLTAGDLAEAKALLIQSENMLKKSAAR